MTLFRSWYGDDPLMFNILGIFLSHADGREALAKAGYIVSKEWNGDDDWEEDTSYGDYDGDVVMHGGEDTAGPQSATERRTPRRRANADSEEEQAIRRRRREAMVLSDGGAPLGQENIIQRVDGNDEMNASAAPNESEAEEQMTRMREEVDSFFDTLPVLDDDSMLANLQ